MDCGSWLFLVQLRLKGVTVHFNTVKDNAEETNAKNIAASNTAFRVFVISSRPLTFSFSTAFYVNHF